MKDALKIRIEDLRLSREELLNALVIITRFRDRETGEHLRRTRAYMKLMLESLGKNQPFSRLGIEVVSKAAMLHDIGKIGIPDSILLKRGTLTPEEMTIMKTHTTLGGEALSETMNHMRSDVSILYAREIAECHHERFDGTGYPNGLSGEQIPLTARIMAIIDVYDALRSERPYKAPLSHQEALRVLRLKIGTHFDPNIANVFFAQENVFETISIIEQDR
jgi:putative two-component system response regulator